MMCVLRNICSNVCGCTIPGAFRRLPGCAALSPQVQLVNWRDLQRITMPRLRSSVPTLVCLTIYGASFLCLFPFIFKDLRYSFYYRNPFHNSSVEMAYHSRQNDLRVEAASHFWSSLHDQMPLDSINPAKKQQDVDIDVMVITTSRRDPLLEGINPKFLTQILWQFLLIFNSTETRALPWKITLSICNVDAKVHEEASNFSSIVRYFQRYSVEPEGLAQVNIKEKEKQDYAFCLEQSLKSNPRYSLLVEDDAFPHPQLFQILYYLLDIRKSGLDLHASTSDALFYKLYHPERLLGFWSLEPECISQLISLAVLAGSCATFVLNRITSHSRTISRSMTCIYVIWLWAIVYFLLTAIVISRQHLIELQYLSKHFFTVSPTPSCCTPGMLFVADRAEHWLHYMQNHTCQVNYGKDKMLDDYRHKYNVKGLIVQPNLFVHIGFFSTLSKKFLDPSLMYYPKWFNLF